MSTAVVVDRTSAELRAARVLFLFGDPTTGRRVTDLDELAKAVGCSVRNLWRYKQQWCDEFEELVRTGVNCQLKVELSDEDVEKFRQDLVFTRDQTSELKNEINLIEKVEEKLYSIMRDSEFSEETEERFVRLAEKFFSAVHTKSKLRSQWIAMEKEWVRMSGIEGKMEIVQNAEKARAIGRVKIDLKREETEQTPGLKVAKKPVGGIFAD